MARLSYSALAFSELDRPTDFLRKSDSVATAETLELIAEATALLKRHPPYSMPSVSAYRHG